MSADTSSPETGETAETMSPEGRLMALFRSKHLSPTHRRVGQYIVDNAREAIFMSSVELAKEAGVSQASVARFAVAMGFDGYQHMQKGLRKTVGAVPSGFPQDGRGDKLQDAVHEEETALERLRFEVGSDDTVQQLGASLARSSGFISLGLRHAAGLATYFGYLAAKVHPNVRTVTEGGSTVLERVLFAHRDGCEWLVCFALPRYPAELKDIMEYAKSIGMNIAMVSSGHPIQLAGIADVVIPVRLGSGLTFDCPVAPTMVAGLILESLCDAKPRAAQQRLDDEDQVAMKAGVFLPD